jgi:hypothetical protein
MTVARVFQIILGKDVKVRGVVVKDFVRLTQGFTVASNVAAAHEENTVGGCLDILEIMLKPVGHICSTPVQSVCADFKLKNFFGVPLEDI